MATHRREASPRSDAGPLRQLGDEELMQMVAGGDPRAFEIIYERHGTAAFSLAYRICGVRATAEEVAQEAFLAIWRSGARYDRTRGSVRTWLLGVVHNRAIDVLRRNTAHERRRAADEQAADWIEAPERTDVEVARREEARSVRVLLDGLPAEQRRTRRRAGILRRSERANGAGGSHAADRSQGDVAQGRGAAPNRD